LLLFLGNWISLKHKRQINEWRQSNEHIECQNHLSKWFRQYEYMQVNKWFFDWIEIIIVDDNYLKTIV